MEAATASSELGSVLGLTRSSLKSSGPSPIRLSFRQPPWPASRLVRSSAPGQAICATMEPESGSPHEVREEIARCYGEADLPLLDLDARSIFRS